MSLNLKKDTDDGFAVVEALLIVVIVAAIAGVGVYVMNQKKQANNTLSNTTSQATTPVAAPVSGTTASISQLTQQDSASEANIDHSSDTRVQSNLSSANSASSNVGGAYNENNL